MAEYNPSENARRPYTVVGYGLKPPSSNWSDIRCPFCGTVSRAYWWSIAGGGKCCENKKCGAKHTSYGDSMPRVGREDMHP
jgi:hypothetical protein